MMVALSHSGCSCR